jgi:putative FmdB family regulatory protein
MPTYEYQCPEGHVFEKFQKMSDKPGAKCPVCGKAAVRKISGGAGLVFKGSGFYITDYGKDGKGPRKAEPDTAEDTKGSDSKAGSAKPDKPDAKAPSKGEAAPLKSGSRQGKGKAASE